VVADLGLFGGNRTGAYLRKRGSLGGKGVQPGRQKLGGDRGDWTVVRSRKRKATQPEDRGRDRSRVSEQRGGSEHDYGKARQSS